MQEGGRTEQLKTYPTFGVCGLDCGLCPRYYTAGPSRCPGCGGPQFSTKHPSCSFITCCVKRKGLEVCGQCPEFPCSKFKSEDEYRQAESSSYPAYRKVLSNLRFTRQEGIEAFIRRQRDRIVLLESMLRDFDDGRSRSFFCRAAALLEPTIVTRSLAEAKKSMGSAGRAAMSDADRAKLLRRLLAEAASREGIELTKAR